MQPGRSPASAALSFLPQPGSTKPPPIWTSKALRCRAVSANRSKTGAAVMAAPVSSTFAGYSHAGAGAPCLRRSLLVPGRWRKAQVLLDVSSREPVHGRDRRGHLRRDLVEDVEDLGEVATGIDVPPLASGFGGQGTEVLDVWRQDQSNGAGLAQPPGDGCRAKLPLQRRLIGDQNDDFHCVRAVTRLVQGCSHGFQRRFPFLTFARIAR